MTILARSEIAPGLAIFLNPSDLLRRGAAVTCLSGTPVIGSHYFVCTGVDEVADTSEWVPLLSRDGTYRLFIAPVHKTGHAAFVKPDSYTEQQFWRAKNEVIIKCASTDLSTPTRRNRVSPLVVDRIVWAIEGRIAAHEAMLDQRALASGMKLLQCDGCWKMRRGIPEQVGEPHECGGRWQDRQKL